MASRFVNAKLAEVLRELTEAKLIKYDDAECFSVSPLAAAKIMSKNLLHLATMRNIMATPLDANIEDVLRVLSMSDEVLVEVRHG